jgi:hypothetical protein
VIFIELFEMSIIAISPANPAESQRETGDRPDGEQVEGRRRASWLFLVWLHYGRKTDGYQQSGKKVDPVLPIKSTGLGLDKSTRQSVCAEVLLRAAILGKSTATFARRFQQGNQAIRLSEMNLLKCLWAECIPYRFVYHKAW